MRLFSELAHLRLASTEQCIRLAGFSSYSRGKDRLRRLVYAGFLRRCFIGTILGGKRAVYALSSRSASLLGILPPATKWRADQLVTADQFISHELHIADLYLRLRYDNLPTGIRFIRWRRFTAVISETIRLIPDGYAEVETPAGIRCMFIEMDLGSEALRIWKDKTERYLRLAASGDFEKLSGHKQFRVLVIAPTERRLLSIRKEVAAATSKIFWFASTLTINEQGLWSSVWLRPAEERRVPLM